MAQSRLERIGTIFDRITSLMKGGALKPKDKPMWYVIYEAFPPMSEPRFDRPAPNIGIKDIFYKEDLIRAKLHKNNGKSFIHNLTKNDRQSQTLQFIEIYQNLQKTEIPEAECYEKALEKLAEKHPSVMNKKETLSKQPSEPSSPEGVKNDKPANLSQILET